MAVRMVRQSGHAVLEARDGTEAVDLFRRHADDIQCVVCDLTLPHRNGWDVIAALRALRPDIPVVLASGYDKAHALAGDHREWPQVFLGKPFVREQLRDALNEALRHPRPTPSA